MHTDLINLINELREKIFELDALVIKYSDADPSVEEVCDALLQLNLGKRDMSLCYDSLAAIAGGVMERAATKDISMANGAQIERKVAYDRKGWQHKDLAIDVARKLSQSAIDMDTGEVMLTQEQLIVKMLDYLQPSYWRVGELNKLGINADNYCETGEPKVSLVVRKGEAK